jgi:phenylacetic acid degradation operon negative regulatory protein
VNKTAFKQCSRSLINAVRKQPPSRAPHFLITLFGDTIVPHGGEIWLGSLIDLLAPFGINERLVRTSVYRLTQDEWLSSTKLGRRSYYRLTEHAANSVAEAERRIYYLPEQAWDNEWCLIFTGTTGTTADERTELRKRLTWLGFGTIAPNVFGHPSTSLKPVWKLFEELSVSNRIVVMRARNFDQEHGLSSLEMVRQCFKLDELEKEYRAFNRRYQKLASCLGEADEIQDANPEHCFMIRTMLVHEYRRLLLRDPQLPISLLPGDWAGNTAHDICATIYRAITPFAQQHIMDTCEDQLGPVKKVGDQYRDRFRF